MSSLDIGDVARDADSATIQRGDLFGDFREAVFTASKEDEIDAVSREFFATLADGSRHLLLVALRDLLRRRDPLRSAPYYPSRDAERRSHALAAVRDLLTPLELEGLALSRLLANCYLFRWFGRQPMDIDACFFLDGKLGFVEFKRKYPARSLQFGMDELPHVALVEWLGSGGLPLHHIVLCDPAWEASLSPTHLLDPEAGTAQHALWLGARIRPSDFGAGAMHTSGADSGMRGGERTQRPLALGKFQIVGEGLSTCDLDGFLRGNGSHPEATADALSAERDAARRLLGLGAWA